MKRFLKPIENKFLLAAVVLGIMMLLIVPPGFVPDEGAHFMRAYGIANGEFVAKTIDGPLVGGEIPVEADFILRQPDKTDLSGTYGEIFAELFRGVSGETKTYSYNTSAVYNFVCYLPQAVGIFVGKILGFSVLSMIYLARIFNYTTWLFLVYWAVKLSPKFKKFIMFVSLLPIVLQGAISLSPDALTLGVSIFMVAYVLYLRFKKVGLLDRKEKTILILTAIVISLCKIVYFPLVFIYLIIPVERFGSNKKKWWWCSGTILLSVILNTWWLSMSLGLIVETNPGVDSQAQISGILHNPFRYMKTILLTINSGIYRATNEMLGMELTSFCIKLPAVFFFSSFAILMILLSQRDEKLDINMQERILFAGIFMVVALLIMTSLYIQWTPYNETLIGGIQGRYFVPILLLIPIIFARKNTRAPHMVLVTEKIILYYSVFINMIAFLIIFFKTI